MRDKKDPNNFIKILFIIIFAVIVIAGLVMIEIWLTNWLGFAGYVLSMVFRVFGLSCLMFVMVKTLI